MDIRSNLIALLEPWTLGDEVLPGVHFVGASTELGMRLRFELADGVLWVDVLPVEFASAFAARTERLAFGYRTEGDRRLVDPQLGLALCRVLAERAKNNERRVLRAVEEERGDDDGARIRHVDVAGLLEPAGHKSEAFYTLSPYVGCTIGCRFCYASSKVDPMRALLGLPAVPWGSYVDVRRNAAQVLADELEKLPVLPIKFCPVVSDPYQAIERRERLTRQCLEAIRGASRVWPALLLTRSKWILDDLELIASLPRLYAGVSLPTIDDEVRAHFEPRASSVPERLEVLRLLRKAGVSTIVIVQPIFAGSLERLADALAETADSVSIDVLRGVMRAENDFATERHLPTREHAWQVEQARTLARLLGERGVAVWNAELPPGLR
ncbi:MAG TPA: radical SAM protein [Polyangium sp.]|nr:radical SAM protein [Polyangium sp.]